MPQIIENTGSTARDFCMLERNCLAHIKLALLLSLTSYSVLLRARLAIKGEDEPGTGLTNAGLPIATLQFLAAMGAIAAGLFEYHQGYKDMRHMRAFLVSKKPHFAIITVVTAIIMTTCVILLADENDL
ncbi:hypothetical protein PUNSTDRAFT_66748 [Punctularia strigosozonata HHB-11173 SS5]|uniref:uncharacterized protein n=1 Tax=Punctularia strigosozonata (strain HHB-11173) TaxID=741275 RepID=UPI00044180D8|nr:uncharacterized protein PUNSTDRAFT_66748 [Punctularia strigosozonata HHB-11173 SS5]EIN09562.1 hypothetical protein PUNSTDRAFT_66748 [Punctularia strigosozonata HHB-11173 SS5]